ncbi:MAG: hypothetical protein EOP06_10225, partial [Proteobacteria bacterium]
SKGIAIMGTGSAKGQNRAVEAATAAISSPLLENIRIDGATGIIINVTGGSDMSLLEVNEASMLITEAAHEDAEIIFGAVIDDNLGDEVRVTVIATGFAQEDRAVAGDALNQMQQFLSGTGIQFPSSGMTALPPIPAIPSMPQMMQMPQMPMMPSMHQYQQPPVMPAELPPIQTVQNSVHNYTYQHPADSQNAQQGSSEQNSYAQHSQPVQHSQSAQHGSQPQQGQSAQQNQPMQHGQPAQQNSQAQQSQSAQQYSHPLHQVAPSQPQGQPTSASYQDATPIAPVSHNPYSQQATHQQHTPQQAQQMPQAPQMQQQHQAPNPSDAVTSPRDLLMAKARAFKESQDLKARHSQPEQLSMNVDHEAQSLEEARKMAREVLSSPFANQNLDVPAFIRKKQGFDLNKE